MTDTGYTRIDPRSQLNTHTLKCNIETEKLVAKRNEEL